MAMSHWSQAMLFAQWVQVAQVPHSKTILTVLQESMDQTAVQ
jgi:hypothetical protein